MSIDSLRASLADRYTIERELGAGGMATVFLAHDIKHDRKVAIKVLKPELAAVLGAERFLQEIKTTAALQHPHILPLFDSGIAHLSHPERAKRVEGAEPLTTQDPAAQGGGAGSGLTSFLYYVMPFIDGETLRDKLNRETQLGIDEAIKITTEVADALHHAHTQGVVHRDIKPENILLANGRPMVADFGIAIALSAAAGGRMTETGMSLGTPHYMSPEQATADKEIGPRSDVYSLASVLFEMLTGEPPHMGGSAQAIIMKIIAETAAPVTKVRKSVPGNVAAAVGKALEKLPADRFESAQAFAQALANPGFTTTTMASSVTSPKARPRLVIALASAAVVLAALAAVGWLRTPEPLPAMRWDLGLDGIVATGPVEISGDGSVVAVPGIAPDGGRGIFIREVGAVSFTMIPGTEDVAGWVNLSDDGSMVLYKGEQASIQRVTRGGSKDEVRGADPGSRLNVHDWGADGTVLFGTTAGLFMRSDGSDVQVDTATDRDSYGQPSLLPDQGVLLGGSGGLRVLDLDGTITPLREGTAHGLYLEPGWLMISDERGVLSAVPFSLEDRTMGVSPVQLGSGILVGLTARGFSASRTGTIVMALGQNMLLSLPSVLELIDPIEAGRARINTEDVGRVGPRFDPTARRLAYQRQDGELPAQVWLMDLDAGTDSPLTFEGENGGSIVWSRAGDQLFFGSIRESTDGRDIFRVRADRPGSAELVLPLAGHQIPLQALPGNRLLVLSDDPEGGDDILMTLALDTGVLDTFPDRSSPVVRNLTASGGAAVSPEGTLIAFRSEFAGNTAFWVREYPEPSGRYQVPTTGGFNPIWSDDGKTLYSWVRSIADDSLVAITVDRTSGVQFRDRRVVHVSEYRGWDLHPDGRRFVVSNPASISETAGQAWREFAVLLNWHPER